MRRGLLAFLCLSVFACGDDTDWSLPGGPERAVVYVSPNDPLTLEAVGRTAQLPAPSDRGAARAPVTVLAYEATLAELGLSAGPIPLTTERPRRPLPPTAEIFERTEDTPWSAVELSSEIAALRIASPGRDQCLDLGGCAQSVDGEAACLLPCGAPTVDMPAVPAAPATVDVTPCPDRWQTVDRYGQTVCTPPAAAGACARGLAQWATSDRCDVLQTPCPAGRFAEGLPPTTIYTSSVTTGMPDGTQNAPYPTLAQAIAAAPDNGIVALANETFTEVGLTIGKRVTLIGACATTVIDAPITIDADVDIEDVTIDGGVTVEGAAHLTMARVELEGPILSVVGTATLTAVLARASVRVGPTGRVTANQFASDGAADALDVEGSFVGRNVAVRRARMRSAAVAGTLRLSTSIIELGARGVDVSAGGVATLEDAAIRGLTERTEEAAGVHIRQDGEAVLSRVLIEDVPYAGVRVLFGSLVATDLVVLDPFAAPAQDAFGVVATSGTVDLATVFIGGVPTQGLRSFRADMTVDDARLVSVGTTGVATSKGALYVDDGASLDATRIEIVDAGGRVAFFGAGTESTVRDLTVRNAPVPSVGRALEVTGDADVTIARALLEGIGGAAFDLSGGTTTIDEVTIVGAANGFVAAGAAEATVNRVRVSEADTSALAIAGTSNVTFGHAAFIDGAAGVVLDDGATVLLTDFEISGSTDAAITLNGAGFEARRGWVHDNAVGVSGTFEWRQLTGVKLESNGTRFSE